MKPRLSPALQQHLVLTPQLRQAIRLLQLSTAELEAEIADAVASNPLLDWTEESQAGEHDGAPSEHDGGEREVAREPRRDAVGAGFRVVRHKAPK